MFIFTRNALIAGVIAIYSSTLMWGQTKENVLSYTNWFAPHVNVKFAKWFVLGMEGQFRFINNYQSLQHQARITPEFIINKNFSIAPVAYVYTWNYPYEHNPLPYAENEHRIFEQVTYKHRKGRVYFNHRLRFEQRFIQSLGVDSTGQIIDHGYTKYRNRIRYRFLMNITLNKKGMENNTWFLQCWDEYMFSFADSNFDPNKNHQNRVFLGAGYQLNKTFTFTLGAIYQMQMKRNGNYIEHNVGPLLVLTINPDLTTLYKKKKAN